MLAQISMPPSDPDDNANATPRWVLVFGGILIALVLIFLIVHLAGGGFGGHGP